MSVNDAVKLVKDFGDASVRHYRVVNGEARGSAEKAAKKETKAAGKLIMALSNTVLTDEELHHALW